MQRQNLPQSMHSMLYSLAVEESHFWRPEPIICPRDLSPGDGLGRLGAGLKRPPQELPAQTSTFLKDKVLKVFLSGF